jgi:predicted dehydrogenase
VKTVKIIGAGSIGNHLAFACRAKNWKVVLSDLDSLALERTKNDIYPTRYGIWDENIELTNQCSIEKEYDIVIIGTPPDTHLKIVFEILQSPDPPKVILIEKPLTTPDLERCDELLIRAEEKNTKIFVGYNHNLTQNTFRLEQILSEDVIGEPLSIHVRWLEHWGGIFSAHPWLKGPEDSYLGFSSRGGGACCEHSHAIALWHHLSNYLDCGQVKEVTSAMDIYSDGVLLYDRTAQVFLKTEKGLSGSIILDVVSEPAQKVARIQGTKGFIEWYANMDSENDALVYQKKNEEKKIEKIRKTRPDDFKNEIDHIEWVLDNKSDKSPISLERGLEVMKIIAAAHLSHQKGEKITFDCT